MNVLDIGEGWPDDYRKTFAKCQKAFSNIKRKSISPEVNSASETISCKVWPKLKFSPRSKKHFWFSACTVEDEVH